MNYSLTYKGIIAMIIGIIFQFAGVPFVPEKADGAITFIVELVGVITTMIGRNRAGGVNAIGFKK